LFVDKINIKKGAVIFIDDSDSVPNLRDAIFVPTNAETYIDIKKSFINRYGGLYSDCHTEAELEMSNSFLYKILVENNIKYHQNHCLDLITQLYVTEKCECGLFYFPLTNETGRYCESLDEVYCSIFYSAVDQDFLNDRIHLCPTECTKTEYSFSSSFSSPLTYTYTSRLATFKDISTKYNNNNTDSLRYSLLGVDIYYGNLQLSQITEVPKFRFIDLIANVGGLTGLFLGMSLLSLFESMEFLIRIIYISFKLKKDKQQQQQQQQ
jgi:hypothetical protein